MSKFLTTKEISGEIMGIIRNAKSSIIIISPYIKIDDAYINYIEMGAKNGIRILLIFGKDSVQLEHSDIQRVLNLKNVQCYFCENLHAKCYANEKKAIVTSMNLYTYSEKTNHEMGILVETPDDKGLYDEIISEVNGIKKDSFLISNYKAEGVFDRPRSMSFATTKARPSKSEFHRHKGFCIRCGQPIPFNPDKPFCRDCFATWNRYSDIDYLESFCHGCGDSLPDGSMRRPLCLECYKENAPRF